MRDWVLPFLRELRPETVSPESFETEIAQAPFAWRRLTSIFLNDFQHDAISQLVGSVIADIPKSAFDELLRIYPFFSLVRSAGFCQRFHDDRGTITVVFFCQSDLRPMSWLERRGCVVHELGHLVRDDLSASFSLDDPFHHEREAATDALCINWGFGDEIKSVRRYFKEKEDNYDGTI
jgi:hypothetical protein